MSSSRDRAKARRTIAKWAGSESKPRNAEEWQGVRSALKLVADDWATQSGDGIDRAERAAQEGAAILAIARAEAEAITGRLDRLLVSFAELASNPASNSFIESVDGLRAERDADKATIVRLNEQMRELLDYREDGHRLRATLTESVQLATDRAISTLGRKDTEKNRAKVGKAIRDAAVIPGAVVDALMEEPGDE